MLSLYLALLFWSCQKNAPDPAPLPNANDEFVFFNASIYTVNPNQVWASAIYIKDGRIQLVGTDEEVNNGAPADVERINLKDAFVMPGIHDVHTHPLEAATDNFQFTVSETESDPEAYATDVATALQQNPGNTWLLGWGHAFETLQNATRAPKAILDEVAPDRPVAIMEQTSHSVWCNSKALELLEIDANTPNPNGGIILRQADGSANGILVDNAGNLLLDLALEATAEREENDYWGLVEFALPELAKHGITSLCDARTYWKRNHHKTWQRIADEGKLTARVNLGLWAYPTENADTQIAQLKALYRNDPQSLLKINQIKLYSDGIIHQTTAAMHKDYLVDYYGRTSNNGLNYFSEADLAYYLAELESTGFDFHIHTLGNRGVHEALNAIEQSGTAQGRHRLTHVEFVDPADYPRFAQLNVTADAQVAGDFSQPSHWHDNDYLVDASLSNAIIPLRDLQEAAARITLSSDWDVSTLNPFVGIQNAVRRSPQQLTLAETIRAYTINAAYVMRQENLVGSIEVGKAADFIVLDRNLFDIPSQQIGQTQVLETYLDGVLIYER